MAIECATDVSGGTFCLQGQSRERMCLDYTSRQSGGSAHRGPKTELILTTANF